MVATPMSPSRGSASDVDNGAFGQRRAELGKLRWVSDCAARLAALGPGLESTDARVLALRMWPEVGHFDPGMAAELEHEAFAQARLGPALDLMVAMARDITPVLETHLIRQ